MPGIYILVTGLFYIITLTIAYFSKKHLLNHENKIFKLMLITNLIGIILDVLSMIIIPMQKYDLLAIIVNKSYLVYLVTWITLFTLYTYFISKYDYDFIYKNKRILQVLFLIIILLIFFLPIEFVVSEQGIYSYGIGTLFIYIYSLICIYLIVHMLLKKIKVVGKKKYIPIFSFLGIGVIVIAIQVINPYLLLMTAMETYITFLMYFTIENPDVQIIEEYHEIKDIAKRQNIDKVMFLHNLNQNLRFNLLESTRNTNYLYENTSDRDLKDVIEDTTHRLKRMSNILTKVYDPNLINNSDIKPYNDNYDTKSYENMFRSYRSFINKNIKYTYKIDQNIPKYLYGDILNIKDILKVIVKDCIQDIQDGYLKIKLEVIIIDNICRIIITLKDNSSGYKYEEIEQSYKDGIFKKYVDDLNKVNGSFIINSEVDGITERIIVIDQIISLKDEKKIEKLEKISLKKKIMIVDNSNLTNEMIKYIKNYDIEYVTVNYGVDCLEKIRNYEKFDLIIINEAIEPLDGIETYKKLKENIGFKIPVIILTDKKDFKIKEEYLQLGINDILGIPLLKEEFITIIDKYLK